MVSIGYSVYVVRPELSATLSEEGKRHVPPDIDAAVKTLLSIRNLHVTGDITHVCELQNDGRATWRFHIPTEVFNEMIANVWREGINIRVAIDAVPMPKSFWDKILGGPCEGNTHEEFFITNNLQAIWRL